MIPKNSKRIKLVSWPDTESEQGRCLPDGYEGTELYMVNEFHGEYDENWIVQFKDGVEIARHNPRYVESIIWA